MSEPEILWQIGKPGDGSKEFLTEGGWSEEYDYTIGSDADSINHPSIPAIITSPEATKPSKGTSTDKLNIDFTLERDYGQGQLTLFYNFYGTQEDSLFLNGELLTKIGGVGGRTLKKNEIPLGVLANGKHRLSITTSGGKDGRHAIDYLKLQATVIPRQPATAPEGGANDSNQLVLTNTITDNTVKFCDTFYLKHATAQYLVTVDTNKS